MILPLENTIQHYVWGSPESIPSILGIPNPMNKPMAELWMGAHPKAPSMVALPDGNRSLRDLISEEPERYLGASVAARFGGTLPFLFKVLAAAQSLSIQAHPSRSQAEAGFEAEELAGITIDAPNRNYRDRNHKPEILCALTEFHAMCGFRSVAEISERLSIPGSSLLSSALERLEVRDETTALEGFFTTLLESPADLREEAVSIVVGSAKHPDDPATRWVARLAEQHPGDIGALAPLFLNLVHLAPGEAMFLTAGVHHAYLEGTGVELMANSDNVLRGGLTVKHVDVGELRKTLRFKSGQPTRLPPEEVASGISVYRAPVDEFELARIVGVTDSTVRNIACPGPSVVLCVSGNGHLKGSDEHLTIRRGDTCFLTPDTGPVVLEGSCTLYRASVPGLSG